MSIGAGGAASAAEGEAAVAESSTAGGDFVLTLEPAPDQEMVAPTEEDSAVFNVRGTSPASFVFDSFNFVFDIFDWDFELLLVNEVRLIPFFDGGGAWKSPVLAQVGRLFRVRGAGLLLALRIEIVIQIRVVLIVGYRFNVWDFGLFNEFSGSFPWAIGSLVLSVRVIVRLRLLISALVAIVKPDGSLEVIFRLRLDFGIDFNLTAGNRGLHFDPDFIHQVNHGGVGPLATSMFPCDGRFQLAEENGQTVFLDAEGGSQSFYFARAAGPCCLPWAFNLELVRFAEGGGPVETLQQGFRTEFCLNAAGNPDPLDVVIVSDRVPNGFPPPLQLEIGEGDTLRAMGRPLDESGLPRTGLPRRDLTTMGFHVEFYLASSTDTVLDPNLLPDGNAAAILSGQNVIRVAASRVAAVIDVETGEEVPQGFWPGAVLGFDIARFLARGLPPAVKAGELPVIVGPLPGKITVVPTLAYWADPAAPGGARVLTEAQTFRDANGQTPTLQGRPILEMERYEPFEQSPRGYVLALKVVSVQGVTSEQTLTFSVSGAQLRVLDLFMNPLLQGTPLSGALYESTVTPPGGNSTVTIDRAAVNDPAKFFSGSLLGVTPQSTFTARINAATQADALVELGTSPLCRTRRRRRPPARRSRPPIRPARREGREEVRSPHRDRRGAAAGKRDRDVTERAGARPRRQRRDLRGVFTRHPRRTEPSRRGRRHPNRLRGLRRPTPERPQRARPQRRRAQDSR